MSTRYSKLFALPENLYCEGSPVIIAAGALQKDNQTGNVLAQLKICNIENKLIKAATVKITPFDTAGRPLAEPIDFQYLDFSTARDNHFGQKIPVELPKAITTFEELGDYKDCTDLITETKYNEAIWLLELKKYDEAIAAFTHLGDYKDSVELVKETKYNKAISLFESGRYDEVRDIFLELGNYKDCADRASDVELITHSMVTYSTAGDLKHLISQMTDKYVKAKDENFAIQITNSFFYIMPISGGADFTYTVKWLLEDEQVICGYASSDRNGECTITLVDGGIYVESNFNDNFTGTYIKEK